MKYDVKDVLSLVHVYQICSGLSTNEIQIPHSGKHHKVSSLVKSHQNTHNSVKYEVIMKMSNNRAAKYEVLIKRYLRSILDISVCSQGCPEGGGNNNLNISPLSCLY